MAPRGGSGRLEFEGGVDHPEQQPGGEHDVEQALVGGQPHQEVVVLDQPAQDAVGERDPEGGEQHEHQDDPHGRAHARPAALIRGVPGRLRTIAHQLPKENPVFSGWRPAALEHI